MHIGPYDIEGTLGEGGMGVVYRARNRTSGARAALESVRLPKPALLASLRRTVTRKLRSRSSCATERPPTPPPRTRTR